MHYRVSYDINTFYHIYVGENIAGDKALFLVNSNRCRRFTSAQNGSVNLYQGLFTNLTAQNGIASIFMSPDRPPHFDVNHIYVDGGTGEQAFRVMVQSLNLLHQRNNPQIIEL